MANFPTSLDSLTNPASTDKVSIVSHAGQHANANDAIEALEAKVGADASIVTTSHDYKLSGVTGTDKAASLAGSETLTNKRLTTPRIRTAIYDTNGNVAAEIYPTPSATRYVRIRNVSSTDSPVITVNGTATDIPVHIYGKGSGKVRIGDAKLEYPDVDGSPNQIIKTDGSGTLSWVDQATVPTTVTAFPKPVFPIKAEYAAIGLTSSTTLNVCQMNITNGITFNKVSLWINSVVSGGEVMFGIYSEDGTTRYLKDTVTVNSESVGKVLTKTVSSAVTLNSGNYYIAGIARGALNANVFMYQKFNNEWLRNSVIGEPKLEGTITTTAGWMPGVLGLSLISSASSVGIELRLDN